MKFGKEAISLASDLDEVQNVVETAFGSMTDQVDAWAKNSIEQGSPPHTRGLRDFPLVSAVLSRITPACAGTTFYSALNFIPLLHDFIGIGF